MYLEYFGLLKAPFHITPDPDFLYMSPSHREAFAALFYGVEQRSELVYQAEEAKGYTQLTNVDFIHANITQVNFKEFDHFYFYNSFHENIDPDHQIDDTIELSEGLYAYYTQYLFKALDGKPSGTRLVTFHISGQEVPAGYKMSGFACDGLMKMWIKA